MKKNAVFVVGAIVLFVASAALARNDTLTLPIAGIFKMSTTRGILGEDVKLYFGDRPHNRQVVEPMGKAFATGKASPYGRNNKLRSDDITCKEAMQQALLELVKQAREREGNAVVGIVSYYDKVEFKSDTEYECHAGNTRAVVELRGMVLKLGDAK